MVITILPITQKIIEVGIFPCERREGLYTRLFIVHSQDFFLGGGEGFQPRSLLRLISRVNSIIMAEL